jgi:hypothetical protein
MRYFLTLLTVFTLLSCEKKVCWRCLTTTIMNSPDPNFPGSVRHDTTQVCDKTAKEINDYEKQGSYTKTMYSGSSTVTVVSSVNCNQ